MKFEVLDIDFGDCGRIPKTELRRIRALVDIPRHGVKKGDLGGFVTWSANLSQQGDCWIGGDAQVTDDAFVTGNALVTGKADLRDYAIAMGNAVVKDEADIADRAIISGSATVADEARVFGQSLIEGRSIVCDDAIVSGDCIVTDDAKVCETASVIENGVVSRSHCIRRNDHVRTPVFGKYWYHDRWAPDILEAACIRQSMIDALDDFGWHYDESGQIHRPDVINLHVTLRELEGAAARAHNAVWVPGAPTCEISSDDNNTAVRTVIAFFASCLEPPQAPKRGSTLATAAIEECIDNFGPGTVSGVIKENVPVLRENASVSYGWPPAPTDTAVIAEDRANMLRFSHWSRPIAFDREGLVTRIQWIDDGVVRAAQHGLMNALRAHAVRERDRRLVKRQIDACIHQLKHTASDRQSINDR